MGGAGVELLTQRAMMGLQRCDIVYVVVVLFVVVCVCVWLLFSGSGWGCSRAENTVP